MALDPVSMVTLFSSAIVKDVFKAILKERSAIFKQLLVTLGKNTENPEDRKQVESAVSKLKEADLIKERPADIEDFNSYYVTSDGLSAERQLRLADPKQHVF
jgi:hypothetical protein